MRFEVFVCTLVARVSHHSSGVPRVLRSARVCAYVMPFKHATRLLLTHSGRAAYGHGPAHAISKEKQLRWKKNKVTFFRRRLSTLAITLGWK